MLTSTAKCTWVNIMIRESSMQYMLLTDEDLGNGETYILDKLENDGWERFCDVFHTYQKCKWFMTEFYPEYTLIHYTAKPINFATACEFVNNYHRHHLSPQGHKFSVGITDGFELVGVAIAGRPVSRHQDDGQTIEITRLCTKPGYKNLCSLLYAKTLRIARELGYTRAITYTIKREHGTSLMAAGFQCKGMSAGGSWSSGKRPREDKHPLEQKRVWQKSLM